MSIVLAGVALVLALVVFKIYRGTKHLKRAAYIREYVFPQGLLARLPLLFALNAKLNLVDGFRYAPDCSKDKPKKNDHAVAVNCATDFGSSSSSDNSNDGFGDLGFTTSAAGGDSGCGGGGCGGGGGD